MEKYGFVYIWYDKKHKRFYVGSHWGTEDDGYICSSDWMRKAYKRRPQDFKRRILQYVYDRSTIFDEEQKWLSMIKESEISPNTNKPKYYNLCLKTKNAWFLHEDTRKTVGQKISEKNTGMVFGPCSEETKRKISKANTGKKRTPEMIERFVKARKGSKHSEEHKRKISESMKKRRQYELENGLRAPAKEKTSMTKEEQAELSKNRLKELWSDPEWKENQRKRLAEGAKKRPPRSEESKRKSSIAQKGIPKPKNKKQLV